jgi:DNA-binding Lrp family transcriptional regulator
MDVPSSALETMTAAPLPVIRFWNGNSFSSGLDPTRGKLASRRQLCHIHLLWSGTGVMRAFFVQIKCELGKAYEVAKAIVDAEIASEVYSTAGDYDLLAKFYIDEDDDIGHFVNEKIHSIPGIKDTYTTITFRAF